MKRLYLMILALLTLVGGVNAETVETTLWEGTYTDGIEINSETVATFKAGDVLRVYVTVPEGGANFKICYKGAGNGWSETTIPSIGSQWPWVNGGETYYDVTLTDADITALSGQNIYIYKGEYSVITKVGLITTQYTLTVAQPETGGTIKNGESAAVTAQYREGTVVTLEAEAAEGYTFVKWTKDGEDAGTETTLEVTVNADMTVSAVFEEVTYVDFILSDVVTATGNWSGNVDLSYKNKGELANAQMNDIIRITYKDAGEDAKVRVANPDGWEAYEDESEADATPGDNQTFEYTITSAKILEKIQQNGILGRGKNITITKIELLEVDDRYDAVPVTIGEDGVATFSSSKKLDFSGTGITPYYASAVETGQVTLTSVDNKTTWSYQGYILKGSADTYDIPVINDAFEPSTNFLKATNDYSADVAASIEGTYHYIFAKDKSDNKGFFKLETDHTLAAHRAYLETSDDITPSGASGSARLVLRFEDEDDPTAIGEVKSAAQPVKADNVYYNLNGQRVEKPTKGIYILNGKKVLF